MVEPGGDHLAGGGGQAHAAAATAARADSIRSKSWSTSSRERFGGTTLTSWSTPEAA